MKSMPLILAAVLLLSFACAPRQADGPTVRVWDAGRARKIPAADFDEKDYLGRGFTRTTDGRGQVMYVRIPESDKPKDITFLMGSGTGKEASFGGMDGQYTGRPSPLGIMLP